MSEVLHANIFFFITGIAVIVFSALLSVALYHGIKALKTLRRILDTVEEGTEVISEDMKSVRAYFTEEGLVPRLLSTLMGTSRPKHTREKHPKQERKRAELKVRDES